VNIGSERVRVIVGSSDCTGGGWIFLDFFGGVEWMNGERFTDMSCEVGEQGIKWVDQRNKLITM
jgi:hypothetical protein